MKISNPFRTKAISENASLEQIQKTFKGSQTLEVKNGMLKAQTRSLVHELKLSLGLESARARETSRQFRRNEAIFLITEKIAESLNVESVVVELPSISGKAIGQVKQLALESAAASRLPPAVQMDYLKPRIVAALKDTSVPASDRERKAQLLAKAAMDAVAQISLDGQGSFGTDLTLPETLDLALKTIATDGTNAGKAQVLSLHHKQQVAASPELRLQALTEGVKSAVKDASNGNPPFRGSYPAMASVWFSNQQEMGTSGGLQALTAAIVPSAKELQKRPQADHVGMVADRLNQLTTDPKKLAALVDQLPEHYCVSVAAGFNLIEQDASITATQKQALKDGFASNALALRLISPELRNAGATSAAVAFQKAAAPKAASFPDYMTLLNAIADRGRTSETYQSHAASQAVQSDLIRMSNDDRAAIVDRQSRETCTQVASIIDTAKATATEQKRPLSEASYKTLLIYPVADVLAQAGVFGEDNIDATLDAIRSGSPEAFEAYTKLVEDIAAQGRAETPSSSST